MGPTGPATPTPTRYACGGHWRHPRPFAFSGGIRMLTATVQKDKTGLTRFFVAKDPRFCAEPVWG